MKNILVFSLLMINFSLLIPCNAQYTVLHDFNDTNGAPLGDLRLVGKMLYGMTNGRSGVPYRSSVFSMDTDGSHYRILHDFDSTPNNEYHFGSLVYIAGVLYGTTNEGGLYGGGNIFSIDTNGSNYKDLLDFDGLNGAYPGSLTISGEKLYGMTEEGGANNYGVIYKIDTDGSGYEDLYDFPGGKMGFEPYGSLTISGKKMYGMTSQGMYFGNIFSVDTDGNEYTVFGQFDGMNAGQPFGSLTLSQQGVLYGMTSDVVQSNTGVYKGNIFSIDTNGSAYKNVFYFGVKNSGAYPYGSLILAGSTLYGMTTHGGTYSGGIIFSIDTNGDRFKNMYDFKGPNGNYNTINGYYPGGSLTLSGTTLYGMAQGGGANGYGVIFKIDTSAISTAAVNNLIVNQVEINVYPNPSGGIFQLEINKYELGINATVEVYNVLGEQIYQSNINSDNTEINLSNQPNGVYLYRVTTLTGELVGEGKMMVQK